MSEDEELIDSFSTPDDITDLTIFVEEKKIYAHRSILGKKNIENFTLLLQIY